MKKAVERLMSGAMSLLVLALGLGLASTGWAAVNKPLAVWNGDFVEGSAGARGGFTIDLNNGTATENLNTIANNVITIGSGANGGVRFMTSTQTYKNMAAVIGVNTNGYDITSATTGPVLISVRNSGSGRDDIGALYLRCDNNDGEFSTAWVGATTGAGYGYQGKYYPAYGSNSSNIHYVGALLAGSTGFYGYLDGSDTVVSGTSVKDGYAVYQYGVTVGGLYNSKSANLAGATVNYVAIFAGAESSVSDTTAPGNADTLKAWSLTSMTGAPSTDINITDATVGVNLPASATLTASATPAAVFVQQTSTLTVTGSGSLNINSGNGPLYVADGTTLTIDATGITSLTALNPSVTLVSAKIYGTDLITVKKPLIAGGKVTASVTETGITLTYTDDTVSITSPFDGSTLASPTSATGYDISSTSVSFGNTEQFLQTIGGRTAIVADVFGGTFTDINGFMKQGETTSNTNKDVCLVVSGATARRINGVQEAHWSGNTRRTRTEGNVIVQIEDGTTVDYVYGAGYKGGRMPVSVDGTGDGGASAQVQGNTGVTVKGGTVNGTIVGGWTCAHNGTPTVTGNTAVRVETVLGTATATTEDGGFAGGFIIGGNAYQANTDSASLVGGSSFVTLALAGKSGSFDRTVIGGSAQTGGTQAPSANHVVTGNSSVTITAANDVTFANPIVGGGAKLVSNGAGSVLVNGNSSVTISGGAYTGRIVAGGYAPNGGTANVAGTATLTLNSGTFTGATLDGGNATGVKTLVVGDNLDISGATVTGFTAVTLGDGATAQMAAGQEGTATLGAGAVLKLIIGDNEVANGYTPNVSGSGTVEYYEYVESVLTKITDSSRLDGNNLNPSAPVWSVAENASGNLSANWSTDGGTAPATGSQVAKFTVNGTNTLTVDDTLSYVTVYIQGSGTLNIEQSGENLLTVANLEIASGVTVNITSGTPFKVQNGNVSGGVEVNVNSAAALTLDAVNCSTKVNISGTLNTYNAVTLSNSDNIFQMTTSVFNIESGTATVTCQATGYNGFGHIINIKSGATLAPQNTDSLCYYRSGVAVNIWGTLDLGSKRWTVADAAKHIITLHEGAVVKGAGDGNGALNWNISGGGKLVVDGNAQMQASVKILAEQTWTVEVAEGKTLTMSSNGTTATSGATTKTGKGTLNNTAEIRNSGLFTVSEGEIVSTKVPAGNVTVASGAKFTIVDTGTSSSPTALDKFTGTGTLELKCNSAHTYYGGESAFAGKVIVNNVGSNGAHFHGASFSAQPQFEVLGSVTLTDEYNNGELYVKNLTGSGDIKTDYGPVAKVDDVAVDTPRTIKVLQTDETTFSGKFTYSDNSYKHRNACLNVIGENETTHTLTLSGASTTYGELTIGAYAKVAFTSTGSWINGSVAVAENGVLESAKADAITKLTLADGATIVFPTSSSTITGITSLTFTSGKTYISFPNGAPDAETTIIDWTSVGSAPAGEFELVGDVVDTHVLTKGDTGLTIKKGVASVRTTLGVTHYAFVPMARLQAINAGENLVYFTIVSSGDVDISYFEGMKIKNAGGANITITGVTSEYSVNTSTTDGITTYSRSNAPTSYVWTNGYPDNSNWTVPPNWNVSGGTTAGRYPQAGDTVTFNDGATVTLNESATVAGVEVNGEVSISATAKSLNVSGNITTSSTGTLTLSDVCLASAAAGGITVAPNVNFTSDSELAWASSGMGGVTINGDVTFSGSFKAWDTAHTINGAVTINSYANFSSGNNWLIINGAATVKGAFTAGSTGVKFCDDLIIEDGSITADGSNVNVDSSTVSVVLAGATATFTDSRGEPVADNKVSTTVADSYVKKTDTIFAVAAKRTVTVSADAHSSVDGVTDGQKFVPGEVLTITASADTYYTPTLTVNGEGQTSPYELTTTDADVTVSVAAVLDTYTITIPVVANTTVSVSYTSGGESQTATTAGDITVDAGTSLTATWAAVSGYQITAGAEQTINPVAASATLTEPTVAVKPVAVTGATFDYYATYATADVTATVTEAGSYTLTVGGNSYNATAEAAGNVTFSNVDVSGTDLGGNISYTITETGASGQYESTAAKGSAAASSGWMLWNKSEYAANSSWTTNGVANVTELPYGDNTYASFSGTNTYSAAWVSTGEVVTVTTSVKFGDVADPEMTIDADAQAAVRLFDDGGDTFQVLTNSALNAWANVSNVSLEPSGEEQYSVEVKLNYSTQTYGVKIGSYELALTDDSTVKSFPLAKAASAMQKVSYLGAGSFISLSGKYVSAGYTADVGTNGSATNVVVSSDFVNDYLSGIKASEVAAALSPSATDSAYTGANGYNYFSNYALGLDPTDADDKPTIKVETNSEGKFVVTLVDGNGDPIVGAANVALTLKFQSGTDPNSLSTEMTSSFYDGSATINPSEMTGNVQYYKVQVDIGAK